jgi:thioredoxin-dependent peroxiredoxin
MKYSCQCQSHRSTPRGIHLSLGQRLFLISLGLVTAFYAGLILGRGIGTGKLPHEENSSGRWSDLNGVARSQIVPLTNPREDAQQLLADVTGPGRTKLLQGRAAEPVPSQSHPLVGRRAPAFKLPDSTGQLRSLPELVNQGPIVLVFYYGYHCGHCVAQLVALDQDLDRFRKAGAQVVAISGDPSELTRRRFEEFGAFHFPVLADADNKTAEHYGAFRPATEETDSVLYHGTFVISREGKVIWANLGFEPFTDNESLLAIIDQIRDHPSEIPRHESTD